MHVLMTLISLKILKYVTRIDQIQVLFLELYNIPEMHWRFIRTASALLLQKHTI